MSAIGSADDPDHRVVVLHVQPRHRQWIRGAARTERDAPRHRWTGFLRQTDNVLKLLQQLRRGRHRIRTHAGNRCERTGDVRLRALGRQIRNDHLVARDEALCDFGRIGSPTRCPGDCSRKGHVAVKLPLQICKLFEVPRGLSGGRVGHECGVRQGPRNASVGRLQVLGDVEGRVENRPRDLWIGRPELV